ncbi:MAG: hypothetical protein AB2L24_00810 [Mangrovibacterium sp.]
MNTKIIGIQRSLFRLVSAVSLCLLSFSCEYTSDQDYEYADTTFLKIQGAVSVSAKATGAYATYYLENADYVWTVPEGATIKSGQGTSQITVLFGTNSGTITVNAKGMSAELGITVR